MHSITIYILRQLTIGAALVTGGLLCILWLTQSLRFVELVVTQGIAVAALLQMTALLLVRFFSLILPFSAFAVVLFTYNRLALDREIVVLQAAGMSSFGLAKPALILGGLLTALSALFSLWLGPRSDSVFKELKWAWRNNISQLLLQEGAFNTLAPGLTIYVQERAGKGELVGILIHDKRTPDRAVTVMAKQGVLIDGDQGLSMLLANGNRQEVVYPSQTFSILHFDSYAINIGPIHPTMRSRSLDTSERSTLSLFTAAPNTEAGLSDGTIRMFRIEAHRRVLLPFFNLLFPIIALACLFSGGFDRRGGMNKILAAIVCVAAVEFAFLGAANAASKDLSLTALMYASTFIPLAAASWTLFASRPFLFLPPRFRPS